MSPQNNKIQTTRFMSKGDTKQNWSENNPILLEREVGYELDTNSYKIGDGVTHWNELPYATIGIKDNDKIILQSNQVYLSNNKKLLTKDDLPTGGDTAGGVGQATADNGEIFNNYEKNKAVGNYSHSEGTDTIAYGNYSHAEGRGINGKESLIEDNEFGSLIELVNRLGGIKIASVIKNENGVESLLEATLTINKYIFDLEGLDELPYECLMEIENNILVPVKNAALISISESDILGNQTARIKFDLYNEKANGITKEQKITNIYSGTAIGEASHSEGYKSNALGKYSHVEGEYAVALGTAAHAEGRQTNAKGNYSHTEGRETQTIGKHSHAEGYGTHAINNNSHAEGSETIANGENSHAEGYGTHAIGKDSHAEGYETYATGKDSHTEGYNTQANKDRSHAEGNSTQANGKQSHAEGWKAIANGDNSHAEGRSTIANGENSHAEGYNTQANGYASHAEGWNTIASSEYQNVIGKFNIEDYENKYVAVIGNGQPSGRNYDYTTKISTASYSGSLDASKRIATFQPWEYGQEIGKGQTPYTMHFGMTVTELTAPLYLEYNYSIDGGAKRTLLTFSNSQVGVGQGFNDSNKIIDVTVPYTINIFMNTIDCDGVIYINDQLLYQGSLRNSSNDIKWREIRVFSLAASENIKFTATDINASIYNNIVSTNDAIMHYIIDDKALRAPALLNSILPLEQKAIKGYFYKQLENSWAENKVVIENNDDQTYSVQAPNYSNAYTLDWDGNAWFAGDVVAGDISLIDTAITVEALDLKVNNAASITIGLDEVVPENVLPGICNFTLIPQTKIGVINIYGDTRGFFNPEKDDNFYGMEVPLITTRGKIVVKKGEEIKYEKEIPELINFSGISDEMKNDKITKRWSGRFYINRTPNEVNIVDNDVTADQAHPNYIFTWLFTKDDFADLGIPTMRSNSIPIVSPIFLGSDLNDVNNKAWTYAHPVIANFSYNSATEEYQLKCRMRSYNPTAFLQWTKSYFCYPLENEQYIINNTLFLYLNDGYKVTFEQDNEFEPFWNRAIKEGFCPFFSKNSNNQVVSWWRGVPSNAETYINTTPTVAIIAPLSISGSLEGMEQVAKELNKNKSEISIGTEYNNYAWIGNGDGSTDYSTKIQNKLDEVYNQGGGTIYLGSGIYPISQELLVRENVRIVGAGKGVTCIRQTSDNTNALVLTGWRIGLQDLTIELSGKCTDITACVVTRPDNIKCRYYDIENVEFIGTYDFKWTNGYATIPAEALTYKGVGIYSTDYFNFSEVSITASHLYAGVYGGGSDNTLNVYASECRYAVYAKGGQNIYNVVAHSFYAGDSEGKTLVLSDCAVYCDVENLSSFNVRYGDEQHARCIIEFSSKSINNSYTISSLTSYTTNTLYPWHPEEGTPPRAHVIDNGLGNVNVSPLKDMPYAIGSRTRELSGLVSPRLNLNGAADNALSGVGKWGDISSNIMWQSNGIELGDVCRYPDGKAQLGSLPYIKSTVSPSVENPIDIEIDVSDRPIYGSLNAWIQFYHQNVAKQMILSFDTSNDGIYNKTINITENYNTVFWFNQQTSNDVIYRIKISIIEALKIPELTYQDGGHNINTINYNADGLIAISNIGCVENSPFGRAFLGECGGNLYGNVDMHNNTFKNVATPTESNDAVNKSYVDDGLTSKADKSDLDWKLIGETEVTEEDITAAGEDGVTAVIIDFGKPIDSWYSETMVITEIPISSDINNFTNGRLFVLFGKTEEGAINRSDGSPALVASQGNNALLTPAWNQQHIITSNWLGKKDLTHSYVNYRGYNAATGYTVTPYTTESWSNKANSIVNCRYLAIRGCHNVPKTDPVEKIIFKFPAGSKISIYGRM